MLANPPVPVTLRAKAIFSSPVTVTLGSQGDTQPAPVTLGSEGDIEPTVVTLGSEVRANPPVPVTLGSEDDIQLTSGGDFGKSG